MRSRPYRFGAIANDNDEHALTPRLIERGHEAIDLSRTEEFLDYCGLNFDGNPFIYMTIRFLIAERMRMDCVSDLSLALRSDADYLGHIAEKIGEFPDFDLGFSMAERKIVINALLVRPLWYDSFEDDQYSRMQKITGLHEWDMGAIAYTASSVPELDRPMDMEKFKQDYPALVATALVDFAARLDHMAQGGYPPAFPLQERNAIWNNCAQLLKSPVGHDGFYAIFKSAAERFQDRYPHPAGTMTLVKT